MKRNLRKDVLEKFREKKMRYFRNVEHERNANEYISWQKNFNVKTEKVCRCNKF